MSIEHTAEDVIEHTAEEIRDFEGTVDWDKINATTGEDIERQALDDGDTTDIDPASIRRYRTPFSVRFLRERMNLSQAEFAARFGLRVDIVKNWEESGVYIEDPAALALLRVIEQEPEAVARVFAHRDVA
jgi:putative transcriptional regulator